MTKQIIYSASNYARLRRDNGYFVDKTEYIAKLEKISNPIFLRPRRFGKSFMCSLLHHYYSLRFKDDFETLFGDTWIGQNPTGKQNQFIVLYLNFSSVEPGPTLEDIEASFKNKVNRTIQTLKILYAPLLDDIPPVDLSEPVSYTLSNLIMYIVALDLPRLFVIIDEYDNFANRLIVQNQLRLYAELTDDSSFLKVFFKALKEGRETGAIENIYITGILPITIDELASAFNVGTFLTLDPTFESMVGFTQQEVDSLLDEIFDDYNLPYNTRDEIGELIKVNYNGYHFIEPASSKDSVPVYNTTILMYFLRYLTTHKKITTHLTDDNLKTDMGWLKRLSIANAELGRKFVDQLATDRVISYNNRLLTNKFNVTQFFDERFFPTSLFYLGVLTRQDNFYLSFPNLNIHQIFLEYFNEFYHLDTTNPYAKIMQSFLQQPDLEALFRCYWDAYIMHLPEAVFTKMNENFYRTTFYQICSEHLSPWFIWNLERSYPKGKSDLEFIGKHNEKFSGMRWVIEFKYYSKRAMRKDEINLETFELKDDDTTQIRGYVEGLKSEYPEAEIEQFVIYCFANQGFRLFQIEP